MAPYPCELDKDSKAHAVYGESTIHERHRHRYEVNNDYRNALTEKGLNLCGLSPDGRIVEMIEISDHRWFIAYTGSSGVQVQTGETASVIQRICGSCLQM